MHPINNFLRFVSKIIFKKKHIFNNLSCYVLEMPYFGEVSCLFNITIVYRDYSFDSTSPESASH